MKTIAWQLWAAVALIGAVCLVWLGLAIALLWAVLTPEDWATVTTALGGRIGLLVFLWGIALVPIYQALKALMARYIIAPERLADAVELRLKGTTQAPLDNDEIGGASTARLNHLINQLLDEHQQHQARTDEQIQAAIEHTEKERAWLSALLAELNRSVIVCNKDGHILLYNNRARLQFKRLSESHADHHLANGDANHGGELLGLGRSIYTVIDQAVLEHALKVIERRLAKGYRQTSAQCLMQTDRGRTYRVQVTPVCRENQTVDGMILVIENITQDVQDKSEHQQAIEGQLAQTQALLTDLTAALKQTDQFTTSASTQATLDALSASLNNLGAANRLAGRLYPLEDLSLSDLMEAVKHACPSSADISWPSSDDANNLWMRADAYALTHALSFAMNQALATQPNGPLVCRLSSLDDEVIMTLAWPSDEGHLSPSDWSEALKKTSVLSSGPLAGSFDHIIEHHKGHWVFHELGGDASERRLEIHLPRRPEQDALPESVAQRHEGRPEYYDFRLFDVTLVPDEINHRPLDQLTYTVFDTETTGLNPSGGDEIIQVGAIRIVNGRILSKEIFDQLVDPKRPIPASSTAIHGIRPDDVIGQPNIQSVLGLFHTFCQDTVLVAHNADFDLQCLSLKAPTAGVAFDHPVLDTLLLSAVAHPFQERHNLDDIACRLGLPVIDRHQALGDAKLTAEIFVRLMPVLKDKGIHTLHDAIMASKAVWQKRANY